MKRLLAFALSIALTLPVVSCRDATGPGASLSGTYTLRTLNGSTTAPWVLYQDNVELLEVLSSRITLDASGGYTAITTFRDTYNGVATVEDDRTDGRWSLSGDLLTLIDPFDPTYNRIATVSSGQLTFRDTDQGFVVTAVYSR